MPRLLLCLPQLPQDPASGAARTAKTACEMAAEAGWTVRGLGVTATERGAQTEAEPWLKAQGLAVERRAGPGGSGRVLRFMQHGVSYALLETGKRPANGWEPSHGGLFDRLFDAEIARFKPDVILTYGGYQSHLRRLQHAREAGARIAFCVFNVAYLGASWLAEMDAVLTPSEWLAKRYRDVMGLRSTPLPTPVEMADVVASDREPIFVTMVNPSIEKGLFFFARLAEEIGVRYPDIPLLAVEARGTAGMLVEAGRLGGFDLRRHENLMVAPATALPRDLFAPTRVLLVPSVIEDASGRVVAEALLNGVPPLVSDRGGLGESCNGAGFVLPLPSDLTLETRVPVQAEAVKPWLASIEKLCSDEAFYSEQSRRCLEASSIYHREVLAPRYASFFKSVLP